MNAEDHRVSPTKSGAAVVLVSGRLAIALLASGCAAPTGGASAVSATGGSGSSTFAPDPEQTAIENLAA